MIQILVESLVNCIAMNVEKLDYIGMHTHFADYAFGISKTDYWTILLLMNCM